MKKSDLLNAIAAKCGLQKRDIDAVVSDLASVIADELASGKEVNIAGLGKFTAVRRGARQGRNLQTGAVVPVASHVAPKFKASQTLKKALNPNAPARADGI